MNQDNLKTKLLIEYLQNNPKREFIDIERYAEGIGATYEELEAALIEVGKENLGVKAYDKLLSSLYKTLKPEKPNLVKKTTVVIQKLTVAEKIIASVIIFILLAGLALLKTPLTSHLQQKSLQEKLPERHLVSTEAIPPVSFDVKKVYASQEIIDAKRTFSFPKKNVSLSYSGVPKKEVLGFFPYWMMDVADQIVLEGLSAVSLFGLTVEGDGKIVVNENNNTYDGWSMWSDSRLDSFIKKLKNRKIRVYITLKSFSNENIEKLITSDDAQKQFIANAIQLVQVKSLDGINIDFEYTGSKSNEVRDDFTRLIANLSNELKRQIPYATLSVDMYASSAAASDLFEVSLIASYVDAIIVMGYDINTPSTPPGPVAPLEGSSGLIGYMQSYLERVPPEKLILAVPYYGYAWPLVDTKREDVHILSYAEISDTSKTYTILWNEESKSPYYSFLDETSKREYIVHFENTRSLGLKYDYVNSRNLKGVAIWALGYDGLNNELQHLIFEKFAN